MLLKLSLLHKENIVLIYLNTSFFLTLKFTFLVWNVSYVGMRCLLKNNFWLQHWMTICQHYLVLKKSNQFRILVVLYESFSYKSYYCTLERLLMGCKESNQTNKNYYCTHQSWGRGDHIVFVVSIGVIVCNISRTNWHIVTKFVGHGKVKIMTQFLRSLLDINCQIKAKTPERTHLKSLILKKKSQMTKKACKITQIAKS